MNRCHGTLALYDRPSFYRTVNGEPSNHIGFNVPCLGCPDCTPLESKSLLDVLAEVHILSMRGPRVGSEDVNNLADALEAAGLEIPRELWVYHEDLGQGTTTDESRERLWKSLAHVPGTTYYKGRRQ